MKSIYKIFAIMLLTLFLPHTYANNNSVVFTKPSEIMLVLHQALKDVNNGQAQLSEKSAYEALKLSGFYVKSITAINLGQKILLHLNFVGPSGESLKDWNGKDIGPIFFIEANTNKWNNLFK